MGKIIQAGKGDKYPLLVFLLDTDAIIGDADLTPAVSSDRFNFYLPAVWGKLGGIVQEIGEYLVQLARVGINQGQPVLDFNIKSLPSWC